MQHARDSRAALAQNETIDQRLAKRNAKADAWAAWFRFQMKNGRCDDPVRLLPEAFAKLEQLAEDRMALAVKEIKDTLRKALTP
jgi:hypothetical protein